MIKIATWNVNSIRSRIENLKSYINEENPDIILLQELKCTDEQFPFLELDSLNYNIEIKGQKAYNGVAIMSKFPLYDVKTELPLFSLIEEDNESRYIEARFDYNGKSLKVASVYVPNGDTTEKVKDKTETEKFYRKIKFYRRLREQFLLDEKNREFSIYGGDFNTCPELKDMYSIKKDGDICCNIKERIEFKTFLDAGMEDLFRYFNEDLIEFSWWGYRARCWENNYGLRLDALLTSKKNLKYIENCNIYKKARAEVHPSDHVPMCCLVNI